MKTEYRRNGEFHKFTINEKQITLTTEEVSYFYAMCKSIVECSTTNVGKHYYG